MSNSWKESHCPPAPHAQGTPLVRRLLEKQLSVSYHVRILLTKGGQTYTKKGILQLYKPPVVVMVVTNKLPLLNTPSIFLGKG